MATLIDSYSESNQSSGHILAAGFYHAAGQSFTGNGGVLDSVQFYLCYYVNAPTGNAVAKIYSEKHTTAFGTDSLPDTLLATSDNFDVSQISANYTLYPIIFSGANKITLTNGVYYVLIIEYQGGDSTHALSVGEDATSPTHTGNGIQETKLSVWSALSASDFCFYVYKDDVTTSVVSPFPSHKVI